MSRRAFRVDLVAVSVIARICSTMRNSGFLIDLAAALLPQPCDRGAVLPQADRRM